MTTVPMFRLGSDEFGDLPLAYAASADNLFVDVEDPDPAEITFTGLTRVPAEMETWTEARRFEFLDVDVLSSTGRMLGHYDLDSATVRLDGGAGVGPVVVLEGARPVPLPGGLALWQRWCDESAPLQGGEWLDLSADHRRTWLRIARAVWGVNGYADRPGARKVPARMDGRLVEDETSLYLLLGEAIAGPGGYVGWGLDALDDSLSGLSSDRIELMWDHFSTSRDALGTEYFAEVLEILEERDVSVVLDG